MYTLNVLPFWFFSVTFFAFDDIDHWRAAEDRPRLQRTPNQ